MRAAIRTDRPGWHVLLRLRSLEPILQRHGWCCNADAFAELGRLGIVVSCKANLANSREKRLCERISY